MHTSSSHPAAAVLAAVLAEHGVRHAVVSPGSRNAPLVLALHHQPEITVHVSLDERSAAHHALGLSLATWTPVPAVCTSGTAALNHGPALAEAFHARIPLLSITADRPADVVGRGHGQSIAQAGVHAAHTVHHDALDESRMDLVELTRRARRAVRLALHGGPGQSAGPVHLNVPLEEPLYDLAPAPTLPSTSEGNLEDQADSTPNPLPIPQKLREALDRGRVVVLAGPRPRTAARSASTHLHVNMPCLAERGSGVKGPCVLFGAERVLQDGAWPAPLQPEAVITLGLPPMSKALRNALNGIPHWHVGEDLDGEGTGWDIWGTLQGSAPAEVLTWTSSPMQRDGWNQAKNHLLEATSACEEKWSDLMAWKSMTQTWASWSEKERPNALHVANSASARYAQWLDLAETCSAHATFHANRGVAGIDGCMSTALGWHAGRCGLGQTPSTWLVTGDVAFHYDSNAFLTEPSLQRHGLKVVVINNGGGGIFRWLPGTQHGEVFHRHFETPPARTVASVAQGADAKYLRATSAAELKRALEHARDEEGLVVVEVVTPNVDSADAVKTYLESCRD
ncbi:MAG: 2-succinyl-5-enolpyruvyl-6-hydroxy-3-cyclohexene-1-carboxylic-acid synthase [Bacteroidetes bacterium]|nr:2-succinyl-5-enolpyruvyl-6-hydroxy-3-cyclohexene-1-carboxylic-acid synthase [Bacteroidota bacterium]MDA0904288.1 2-succinyl-5-enolpyruvyl-6-hydroxy-3-cyclohexene-1-carboxylic-acid synthase [Bacteroidota bacterium]MDA1241850.1 2-succinyl-5-enolpyruvyl-6-hydroxy-3-cyclohexene-1-carboxylic-acid synthase [Bacteroidota bacterium]